MKFDYSHKVGEDFVIVTFIGDIISFRPCVSKSFISSFQRIGGVLQDNGQFQFPHFVTANILSLIITNTCFVCGGLMKEGESLVNTWVSFDDFGNDAGQPGTTMSRQGTPKMVQGRKCSVCGHFHT